MYKTPQGYEEDENGQHDILQVTVQKPPKSSSGRPAGTMASEDLVSEDSFASPSHPDSIHAKHYVRSKLVDMEKVRQKQEKEKMAELRNEGMDLRSIFHNAKKNLVAKRKKQVYNFVVDEETEVIQQRPPAGKRQKLVLDTEQGSTNISINICTPLVRAGEQRLIEGGKPSREDDVVQLICKTAAPSTTAVGIGGYVKYLVCPDYISAKKEQLIGKIAAWQQASIEILSILKSENVYKSRAYEKQLDWAKDVTAIICGLHQYNDMPVHCLNRETLIQVIDGVNDREQADFLYQIAKCDKFELLLFTHYSTFCNFELTTRFDGNVVLQESFGKTYIEDLSPSDEE